MTKPPPNTPHGVVDYATWLLAVLMLTLAMFVDDQSVQETFAFGGVVAALSPLVLRLAKDWWFRAGKDGLEAGFRTYDDEAEGAAAASAAAAPTPEQLETSIASDDGADPTPSDQDSEVIGYLNFMSANIAIKGVFAEAADGTDLAGSDLRLYIYDEEHRDLRAVGRSGTRAWQVGRGAVGEAYDTRKFVCATGAAVSDDTHRLTEEEKEAYRGLAAVIATPVFNGSGTVIGVVSAASSDLQNQLITPEAEQELMLAALLLSRILVELLQWFTDDASS